MSQQARGAVRHCINGPGQESPDSCGLEIIDEYQAGLLSKYDKTSELICRLQSKQRTFDFDEIHVAGQRCASDGEMFLGLWSLS